MKSDFARPASAVFNLPGIRVIDAVNCRLSKKVPGRLAWLFASDDPTNELSAAWSVKDEYLALGHHHAGGPENETLIIHRGDNARIETATPA